MNRIKKFFKSLGPGFITGASDDDPAGIATYSQTGAQFGFSQSWLSLATFPLMSSIQEMCGRIGLVTGRGLAGVIKANYSRKILLLVVILLFFANTFNIGADLGAMAASAQLLVNAPFIILLFLFVAITLFLELFVSYRVYVRYLKYLTFVLFSYIVTVFVINIEWKDVFRSLLLPQIELTRGYLINIVALLGTTISPYLFFWQTSEEVEEEVLHHRLRSMGAGVPRVYSFDIKRLRMDTIIGMLFSNIVMFFIIVATGGTLYAAGIHEIKTAADAALALKPLAGDLAFILFSMGIIGTGFLAVPVLAGSASYAVSETFGWKEGLYKKLQRAKGFYATIAVSVLIGFLINFLNINPISALYYSAVINGVVASPLLIMILLVANNKKIMERRVNGKVSNIFGFLTTIIMSIASLALLTTFLVQ